MIEMEWKEMIGKEVPYYGAANKLFKLGEKIWLAVKDDQDGYRSSFEEVQEVHFHSEKFSDQPLAKVRVEAFSGALPEKKGHHSSNNFGGYRLIDVVDGHVWLAFGTDDDCSYYPCFVFETYSKE